MNLVGMAPNALFALRPGAPAVLSDSFSKCLEGGNVKQATLVRPDGDDAFVCRLPKGGEQLRDEYTLFTVPTKDLRPIGNPENLLDGSLFPSETRNVELKITADFVTCTQ